MKRKIFLLIIMMSTTNLFLLTEDKPYYVVINEDGWKLPSLDEFSRIGEKTICIDRSIKNCYEETYIPKKKVEISLTGYFSIMVYNKIPCVKIKSEKITVKSLGVYYYKTQPFGIEIESEKDGIILLAFFLDMDLDGKYESRLYFIEDAIRYFFKFSPKVEEEDRFKGQIAVERWINDFK